jgi:hypothetical protein
MERGEGGLGMRLPAAGLSSRKIACWADVSSFKVAALNGRNWSYSKAST